MEAQRGCSGMGGCHFAPPFRFEQAGTLSITNRERNKNQRLYCVRTFFPLGVLRGLRGESFHFSVAALLPGSAGHNSRTARLAAGSPWGAAFAAVGGVAFS